MNNKNTQAIDLYIDLMKKTLTASVYDESAWTIFESSRSTAKLGSLSYFRDGLRNSLVRLLKKKSILLTKQTPFNVGIRDEGRDWPLFGYTMVGRKRLENVQMCVESVLENNVPGDLVETGAWRGGTTIFMRALLKAHGITDRKVWVADSFEGLPAPDNDKDYKDFSQIDFLKVSLDQVQENFKKFDLLDEQVEFLKGWFCDTLPTAPVENIAVLRLDGDLYASTMDALKSLYHKVSPGGYVIVDDYYSWPSCREAVTEFRELNAIDSEIKKVDWTGAYWKHK